MWLQVPPFLMGGDFHATYVICHSKIPYENEGLGRGTATSSRAVIKGSNP